MRPTSQEVPAAMPIGLLVAGVGRSGTSLATLMSLALGLRGPHVDDVMPPNDANPTGYWESNSLAVLNDELLAQWGSTWWTPPATIDDPMMRQLDGHTEKALSAFRSAFGSAPRWIWKDPRLTVLLDFWLQVLGPQPILVPVRSPQAVAHSISARDRIGYPDALLIWERHTRSLLRQLHGHRVLLLDYQLLTRTPDQWIHTVRTFCQNAGLDVHDPTQVPKQQIARHRRELSGPLSDQQLELAATVRQLHGAHVVFPHVEPGPETPTANTVQFDVERTARNSAPQASATTG
ncbi:MAG: hypothetical protein QOH14_3336 [Pseudonocardiales bacterium]|nr:hypothetical protein [Pseudonocardiales bacterium]